MTFTQTRTPAGRIKARCDRCHEYQTGNARTVTAWKATHARQCATTPRRRIHSL